MENDLKISLMASFAELLESKPYKKITVKEVTNKIGVHRNSFYYYFENIPDLLEKTVENGIEKLRKESFGKTPREFVLELMEYITKHQKKLENYICSSGKKPAVRMIRKICLSYCKEKYMAVSDGERYTEKEREAICSIVMAGMMGVIGDWVETGLDPEYKEKILLFDQIWKEKN